jgi:hypothetical protein
LGKKRSFLFFYLFKIEKIIKKLLSIISLKTLKNLNLENPTQSHGQYTDSPFKGWKVKVGGGQSHAMSWDVMDCRRMSYDLTEVTYPAPTLYYSN